MYCKIITALSFKRIIYPVKEIKGPFSGFNGFVLFSHQLLYMKKVRETTLQ